VVGRRLRRRTNEHGDGVDLTCAHHFSSLSLKSRLWGVLVYEDGLVVAVATLSRRHVAHKGGQGPFYGSAGVLYVGVLGVLGLVYAQGAVGQSSVQR